MSGCDRQYLKNPVLPAKVRHDRRESLKTKAPAELKHVFSHEFRRPFPLPLTDFIAMKIKGIFPNISSSRRNVDLALDTRKYDPNTIDRYITVRKFFKQKVRQPRDDFTRIIVTRTFQRRVLNVQHLQHPYSLRPTPIAFPVRLFHASSSRRQELHGSKDIPEKGSNTEDKGSSTSSQQIVEENSGVKNANIHHVPPNYENYSRFFRRLAMSLPPMHRPTREDFLNLTTNVWQRLRVHFKWFTIKSFRKFDADEVSAFLTWFLMSQTLWILIGT